VTDHGIDRFGGAFGYPVISRVASQLEDRFVEIVAQGSETGSPSTKALDALLTLTDEMARGLG
jgi:hypothetical protein